MPSNKSFSDFSRGGPAEKAARARLVELFEESPIPRDELLVNLGLYLRSLMVAKILYLDELYRTIVDLPGVIMEFGTWWGSNLALLNSLRSVHEPYNFKRKIIGFDTFAGYQGHSSKDWGSEHARFSAEGGYGLPEGFDAYLAALLAAHEQDNVLPHIKKTSLVKGDVIETVPRYLGDHPETIVALANFDLGLYEPTKACLEAIRPYFVPGSVLAMDELNDADFPGETIAFREVLDLDKCRMIRSRYLPDRTYVVIG